MPSTASENCHITVGVLGVAEVEAVDDARRAGAGAGDVERPTRRRRAAAPTRGSRRARTPAFPSVESARPVRPGQSGPASRSTARVARPGRRRCSGRAGGRTGGRPTTGSSERGEQVGAAEPRLEVGRSGSRRSRAGHEVGGVAAAGLAGRVVGERGWPGPSPRTSPPDAGADPRVAQRRRRRGRRP